MITEAELTAALLIIIGIALQVDLFLLYPCDDKNIYVTIRKKPGTFRLPGNGFNPEPVFPVIHI